MNVILILNKEIKRFEIITNIPDEIIEDAEKVEEFLQENGYNLNRIDWVGDDCSLTDFHLLRNIKYYFYKSGEICRTD